MRRWWSRRGGSAQSSEPWRPAAAVRRAWDRLRPETARIARLTTAAVLAYGLAKAYTPDLTDLTGPLTALLVVQATLVHTLRSGALRVASVLTGVLVAVVLSIWVGLTWWSLGIAIAASLSLAHLMRLGDHILETPISAMLILGVSQHGVAAETRIANTLIGAAVGMLFNVVFPPPVRTGTAADAVEEVAVASSDLMRRAAAELAEGLDRERVRYWMHDVHGILRLVAKADRAITTAHDSRRFNPRALASTDPEPVLRSGLSTLDSTMLAVRQVLFSLQEEAPVVQAADDPYGDELRKAFAVVLGDVGDCIAAFGGLVLAEAAGEEEEAETALAETLEILRETRAILTELCFVDPMEETSTWLLRGSILAGVENVLVELDVERRMEQRGERAEQARPRLDQARQFVTRHWLAGHTWPAGGDAGATHSEPLPGDAGDGPGASDTSGGADTAGPRPQG